MSGLAALFFEKLVISGHSISMFGEYFEANKAQKPQRILTQKQLECTIENGYQIWFWHRQRSRHVTRQQLTQLAFRPPFLGLFTKIQTSIWSEFSGQKGMPCFASSLLDSNRRQRALQILNGPTGQEIKILVETAWILGFNVISCKM